MGVRGIGRAAGDVLASSCVAPSANNLWAARPLRASGPGPRSTAPTHRLFENAQPLFRELFQFEGKTWLPIPENLQAQPIAFEERRQDRHGVGGLVECAEAAANVGAIDRLKAGIGVKNQPKRIGRVDALECVALAEKLRRGLIGEAKGVKFFLAVEAGQQVWPAATKRLGFSAFGDHDPPHAGPGRLQRHLP